MDSREEDVVWMCRAYTLVSQRCAILISFSDAMSTWQDARRGSHCRELSIRNRGWFSSSWTLPGTLPVRILQLAPSSSPPAGAARSSLKSSTGSSAAPVHMESCRTGSCAPLCALSTSMARQSRRVVLSCAANCRQQDCPLPMRMLLQTSGFTMVMPCCRAFQKQTGWLAILPMCAQRRFPVNGGGSMQRLARA